MITEAFRRMTHKAIHFVILAASPLVVYFMIYAREGILLLSGGAFLEAVVPMQIIMPTVLMIGITNVLGIQMLVPLGREKTVLYSEIAGALVDLVLNALLIPAYGPSGAAIGTLVAEAAVLAVQYCAMREEVKDVFASFHWIRLCIALALGCAACIWVKQAGFHTLLCLIVSSVCFMGVYGGFLLIRKEEILTDSLGRILNRPTGKERE